MNKTIKKNCSTCNHWKRYLKNEDTCKCEIISGGNYYDFYTAPNYSCLNWEKFDNDFSAFIKEFVKRATQHDK
jgi:hypothetical protein